MDNNTKRALVLAGGGSKGAYEAGILQHLMGDLGLEYDILCGTSVGAINAAFLAQTPLGQPDVARRRLADLWRTVTTEKVHKNWFPLGPIESLWKQSVYNSAPLQQWIRSGLDGAAVYNSGRKLRVVSVSLGSGEVFVANETTPDIADWVIASSAFPVMLLPAKINGDLWADGGLRNVTPLGEAIRAGAHEIDMILCSDPYGRDPFNTDGAHAMPQILMRAIDLLSSQVSRGDLQQAGLKNDLAALKPEYRTVKIRLIEPKTPLPFDSLDFDQKNVQEMMRIGYLQARNDGLQVVTGG